ncbi:ATP-dependent DNA helicase RecG [Mycobacterium sp.]|uniref:ATP-dependent DNA helicase RecG n=1 Tax=Mycobacterium sp. TaxID=1785 RepID=UPI002D6548EC|nr:ATP-dependent DNA helicase RecG [Mycobacterium sp.]HZA10999.1 ATP-dependent DNA helicase RecG [Mycobacterium sp.]
MATLDDRLDSILGRKAATRLDEVFGIRTVDDLLRHYPRSYSEGMTVRGQDDTEPPTVGEHVTLVDVITHTKVGVMKRDPTKPNKKREWLRVTLGDRRPPVTATFFNAQWIKNGLTEGTRVMLSGEVEFYKGTTQLTHPDFLILDDPRRKMSGSKSLAAIAQASRAETGEIDLSAFERESFPIYPASARLQSWDIYACVKQVLDVLDPIQDPLPESLRRQWHLISEDQAVRAIHLAETEAERGRARERLTFDEAVGLQWALVQRRYGELSESGPPASPRPDGLVRALLQRLPFELTAGQREVLDVLSPEMASTRPMNRLLQGEVGSGKTIVAVLAMLQMIDAGYQCALMAPTEVLAAQHARSIADVLGPLGTRGELGSADDATRIALLTGSMSSQQKREVRHEVATGAAGIVIGTHALLQEAVEFRRLGMVVVDEQHRFGVEQRDRLRNKAPADITPHLLVMTATPIPRTVALTVYGDLETSTLRELPRGRQPIKTSVIFTTQQPQKYMDRAFQRIVEAVGEGRQAYVVAPRIDASDKEAKDDKRNAEGPPSATVVNLFDRLRTRELAGLRVGLMHGRLPADDKDAVMNAFRAGEVDVLVCTTVIEVGVDVPNATVMLIVDADRFGISQLHQLRGRIGRGSNPSLCLMTTKVPEKSTAGARLTAVAATLDGFELAELDLKERREGDVLGRNQSGRAITLRLLSLAEHRHVIEAAREFCQQVYSADPANAGMTRLATQFTVNDRVEYLDKA